MKKALPFVLGLIVIFADLLGCGVKGKPLPPLTPAPLGRGEPSFTKATEKIKISPPGKKIEGDFDDEDDFAEPTSTPEPASK